MLLVAATLRGKQSALHLTSPTVILPGNARGRKKVVCFNTTLQKKTTPTVFKILFSKVEKYLKVNMQKVFYRNVPYIIIIMMINTLL